MQNDATEIVLYQADDGTTTLEVQLTEDTVWLSQAQMVELFGTTKQSISLHINNIFREGELVKDSVVKDSLTTASDGKKYKVNYYNLDVIISVGYSFHPAISMQASYGQVLSEKDGSDLDMIRLKLAFMF